jgi:hypothetical protein
MTITFHNGDKVGTFLFWYDLHNHGLDGIKYNESIGINHGHILGLRMVLFRDRPTHRPGPGSRFLVAGTIDDGNRAKTRKCLPCRRTHSALREGASRRRVSSVAKRNLQTVCKFDRWPYESSVEATNGVKREQILWGVTVHSGIPCEESVYIGK